MYKIKDICDCKDPECSYGGIEHLVDNSINLKSQSVNKNVCQLCNKTNNVVIRNGFVVSCSSCQRAVGTFKYDVTYLQRALIYLCKTAYTQIYSYSFSPKQKQEIYSNLLHEQGGRCAICDTWWQDLSGKLHIDHDHVKGYVRGLLCTVCNNALGQFKDSTEAIANAILKIDLFINEDLPSRIYKDPIDIKDRI